MLPVLLAVLSQIAVMITGRPLVIHTFHYESDSYDSWQITVPMYHLAARHMSAKYPLLFTNLTIDNRIHPVLERCAEAPANMADDAARIMYSYQAAHPNNTKYGTIPEDMFHIAASPGNYALFSTLGIATNLPHFTVECSRIVTQLGDFGREFSFLVLAR